MRYFFVLSFSLLFLSVAAFAQEPQELLEPIELRLERTIEIGRAGKTTRFCAHPADDPESRTIGLMFQENLPELGGMIFDFGINDVVHMWMRNTVLSLDMIFINEAWEVVKIAKNTTPFSLAIISSDLPVRRVLEINAGISEKYNIKVGDKVTLGEINCVLP